MNKKPWATLGEPPRASDASKALRPSSKTRCKMRGRLLPPFPPQVPAMGDAAIGVSYRPTRFATARCIIRLSVSQFNFEPMEVEIVGSCSPNEIRQAPPAR